VISDKEFTEESLAVLKWLIAIPSISRTSGDEIFCHTIYNTVSEFTYYKVHPEYLNYIPHDDGKNHSFTAFVRRDLLTTQTLVVMCNTDTSSNEVYGTLKSYAFKADDLKSKLKNLQLTEKQAEDLENEDNIYGLGAFENKSPIAAMLILLKYYTERLWELPVNLLFVCNSESLNGHEGIRTCLPYIHNLINEQNIELSLALSFKPETAPVKADTINVYTANMGKVEAGFYIFGEGTDNEQPFKGFSPTLISSKIIEEIELNPAIAHKLSSKPIAPTFNYLHTYNNRSPNSPDVVHLSFNFPFINLNLLDLVENLKQIAAKAIEKSAVYMEDRETAYCYQADKEVNIPAREAEVIAFSDLFNRAAYHYKGNLKSAIEGLIQKCANEELSTHDVIKTVIERLNELARLPRPSVVIFFGNDFIPQQQLRRNNAADREVYIKINRAVEEFNKDHEHQISIENECPANDNCFIRPVGIDVALKALKDECPIDISTFYNLNAPGITFSYKGGDLFRAFEHVDKTFFKDMLGFFHNLMLEIGPDDAQNFLDKTEDEAMSALHVSKAKSDRDRSDKDEESKDQEIPKIMTSSDSESINDVDNDRLAETIIKKRHYKATEEKVEKI
jgi:arginine utilization protein RocB